MLHSKLRDLLNSLGVDHSGLAEEIAPVPDPALAKGMFRHATHGAPSSIGKSIGRVHMFLRWARSMKPRALPTNYEHPLPVLHDWVHFFFSRVAIPVAIIVAELGSLSLHPSN